MKRTQSFLTSCPRATRLTLALTLVLLTAVFGLLMWTPLRTAQAAAPVATLTVTNTNDSGPGSLRQAIADAMPGDTINFNLSGCPCTITLTSGQLIINKNLTINGPGANMLSVSGNNHSRVFHIQSSFSLTVQLNNLTIKNGNSNSDFLSGGGILNELNSALTITNCVITGNRASFGGGIKNSTGGTLTITNSAITGNTATGDDRDRGGGGGVYQGGASLTIINSTFSGNSAAFGAGGLYIPASSFSNSSNTVTNSTFSGNTNSSFGAGAIFNGGIGADPDIATGSTLTITNSTIVYNTSLIAGGIGGVHNLINTNYTNTTYVRNSIIAENTGSAPDFGERLFSQGNNLIGNTAGTTIIGGSNDILNTNPLLGPLADNGGPTQTHALLPGSPAIDKGSAVTGVTTDQRGAARTYDDPGILNAPGGDGSDIGAYELRQLTVTKAFDTNNGSCAIGDCSLREAIAAAVSGEMISIAVPTVTLTLGELVINKDLTINGANGVTISGNNMSRIFNIGSGKTVTLSGLTLTGGNAGSGGSGGAILNSGNLTLMDTTVTGNTTRFGGGLFNASSGNLTLNQVTVASNTAVTGGGVYNNSGLVTIRNSTLSGNQANAGGGGGIYHSGGTLRLTNATLSGNTASTTGGGLSNDNSGTTTLTHVTITANSATLGSGVYKNSGTVNLRNSLIAANVNNATIPDVDVSFNVGGYNSTGYNLIGNRGATTGFVSTDLTGTGAAPINPRLGPLTNNGGPTKTRGLRTGSPAINAGSNALALDEASQLLTTDQRGAGFLRVVSSTVDIGAFEGEIPACPAITVKASSFTSPTVLTAGTAGQNYYQLFTQSGGTEPATWSISPAIPGLTLNATTGELFGAPTTAGTYTLTVTATDSNDCSGSSTYSLSIACPTITITPPANSFATLGTLFSASFTQTGGIGTTTFSTTSALPSGFTLSSNGTLSGTANQSPSTFPLVIKATDSNGCFGTINFTLQVVCPAVSVPPTLSYNPQTVAVFNSASLAPATGLTSVASITSVTLQSVSAGFTGMISVNTAGVVNIINAGPVGNYIVTVRVTDACGSVRDASFPLVVTGNLASRTNATPVTINANNVTSPYPSVITMSGLTGAVTKVTPVLTLRNDSTTPLNPANLRVLLVSPDNKALVLLANVSGTLSASQNTTLTFDDFGGPLTYTTGRYRPTSNSSAITFPAPAPTSYQSPFPIGFANLASTFASSTSPAAPNGDWKLYVVNAGSTGKASLVSWQLDLQTSSHCSTGYTLGTRDANNNFVPLPSSGLLLPWEASTFTIEVQAAAGCRWNASSLDSFFTITSGYTGNGNGQVTFSTSTVTAKRVGTLLIAGKLVTVTQLNLLGSCTNNVIVTPPSVTNALAGVPFTATVTAGGGATPYNISTASRLPEGLTLTSNGVLSGTPQETGVFPIVLRAIDATGCQKTVNYTLTVSCPPLTLRPDNLPEATERIAYSQALATATAGGYTYAVIAGSLPAGLTLNATTGVLSGTPTAKYSDKFTVQASGAGGCGGLVQEYKFQVK